MREMVGKLKKLVSFSTVILITACGGGGGSSSPDPILPPPTTPPAPEYTPPEWAGESYYESDTKTQYAYVAYSRTNKEDFVRDFPHQYGDELNGGLGYDRTNLGLLKIMNSGLVLANDQEGCYECSSQANSWALETAPMQTVVDINGDGLDDVLYAHRFGPNAITEQGYYWQPSVRTIALINQGNGRLEVDPNVFETGYLPATHDTYISHVADFNNDGYDDWLNIGEGGGYILGGPTLRDHWQHIDDMLYTNMMGINYSEFWGRVWTHTTAIGDLDNDGDIDVFVPSLFMNRDSHCDLNNYGCRYFYLENDGDGNFSIGGFKFPDYNLVLSSVIIDVDQDGYNDIVLGVDRTNDKNLDNCECVGVVLFGNEYNDFTQRIEFLPEGPYKSNNTPTQIIAHKVDQDGLEDLIIMNTNNGSYEDYYDGHSLQILVNENGKFVDKTSQFVDTSKSDQWEKHPTHGRTGGYMIMQDLDNDWDLDIWVDGTAYSPYYVWQDNMFVMADILNNKIPYLEGCSQVPNDEGTVTTQCGTATYGIIPIDIDSDGNLDWLVTNQVGTDTETGIVLSQLMAD